MNINSRNIILATCILVLGCILIVVVIRCRSIRSSGADSPSRGLHPSQSVSGEDDVKSLQANDGSKFGVSSERMQFLIGLDKSRLEGEILSLDLENNRDDRSLLPALFLALAQTEPSRVFDLFDVLPGDYYRMAASEAFPFLAGENPDMLRNFVMRGAFEGDRNRWLTIAACDSLAKADSGIAVALFDDLSPEKKQSPLGVTLLKRAAEDDPDVVVRRLTKHRNAPFFAELFRDVLYTIKIKDPSLAFDLVKSYPEVATPKLIAGIYQAVVEDSPESALAQLPDADPDVLEILLSRRNRDNQDYFSVLYGESPGQALKLLDRLIVSDTNYSLFENAASMISSEDFDGAVSWISTFPDGSARARLLSAALTAIDADGQSSPLISRSLEILKSSTFHDAHSARAVGAVWFSEELSEIGVFLSEVPDSLRTDVVAGILDGADLGDRVKLSEIASRLDEWTTVSESDHILASVEMLGRRLGAADPDYATGLTENLDSKTAILYSHGLVTSWTQNDPGSAARWLSELEDGPVRDASVRAFADAIRPTDSEAADRWLRSLR